MKSLSIFPMSSYKNKVYGLVITLVALVALLAISHGPLPFIQASADEQFNLFFAVVTFGLYMIAWSKEKNDDERVQKIRAKAMQVGLGVMITSILAFIFCIDVLAIKKHEVTTLGGTELALMLDFGLGTYLTVFYIGLFFDPAWVYNDDTVMVNIKKNKQFFVVYFLAVVVLFVLIFLLHKK